MRIIVSKSTMKALNRNANLYAAEMMRLSLPERERREQIREEALRQMKICSACSDKSEMNDNGCCVVCSNNKLPF